jgi:predicted membrane channel-forming protein YqfA (hemolysin III family)
MVPTGARYLCRWSGHVRGRFARLIPIFRHPDRSDPILQSRSPERFAPGVFDLWGSSHQIFHVAVLCAMYTHVLALVEAFTSHHTLDLCAVQAAL